MIPGLLDRGWCERLHTAIERCQASPSQFYGVLSPPGELKVDSDLFRWFDDPDIAEATHSSALPALGAELCGADATVLIEDQWFCSEPGAISRSPWHQDHPYYNLDRPFATIWVTLDDVSADAALRVVEGSHATGITYAPIEFSSSTTTIGGASELEPVPDVDADPECFPVTTWDLRAGDAVAIDSRMLHSTGVREVADRPFRRLSTRYAHPDTRYLDLGEQAAVTTWDLRAGDAVAIDSRMLHSTGVREVADRPFRRLSTRYAHPDTRYLDLGEQAAVFWRMLPHGLRSGDLVASEVFPLIEP